MSKLFSASLQPVATFWNMFEIAAAWRNPVRRTGFYHVYRVFRMCTEQMFAYWSVLSHALFSDSSCCCLSDSVYTLDRTSSSSYLRAWITYTRRWSFTGTAPGVMWMLFLHSQATTVNWAMALKDRKQNQLWFLKFVIEVRGHQAREPSFGSLQLRKNRRLRGCCCRESYKAPIRIDIDCSNLKTGPSCACPRWCSQTRSCMTIAAHHRADRCGTCGCWLSDL